jgi:predicted nuclease with TOPRIM domain
MRTGRSLLVVLVAGGIVAGCGGGELSEQELRDQANQACREYAETVEGLETPEDPNDLGSAFDEAEPAIDDLRSDLEDLQPPAELEERYGQVVQGVEAAGDRLGQLREAAEAEDTERLQQLVGEAAEAQQEADQAAQELGLDACL